MRRLVVLLVSFGLVWYVYGDSFEESGLSGVYEDFRGDVQEIREHPFVTNTIKAFQNGVGFLTEVVSDTLQDEEVAPTLEKPELAVPLDHSFSIHNLELGDSRQEVEAQLGNPKRSSRNEYGMDWVTYHENYQHFIMVAYNEADVVKGLYTNQDLLASSNGITFNSTRDEVLSILPEPLTALNKGLISYQLNDDGEYHIFAMDQSYVTIFYDKHLETKVTAILILDRELEDRKQDYFAEPTAELREGFEYQLFDLTNAVRVNHDLSVLAWEESARETVRAHSADMADNNYFNHTNLEGLSPFDRLSEDAIAYRQAGENLAAGQPSSIFAHEGLMNSLGHRENKLNTNFESLAIGVSFNRDHQPFYTENYLAN